MGKWEKKSKSEEYSSAEDDPWNRRSSAVSDDAGDADEDLTLEIVRRAMLRPANSDPRADGVVEMVTNLKDEKRNTEKKRRRKKNAEEIGIHIESASDVNEIVTNYDEEKGKTEKKRRKHTEEIDAPAGSDATGIDTGFRDFCGELFLADNEKDDDKPDMGKVAEVSTNAVDTNPVHPSDNAVLRKLLRGPRYFDPPDNSWGACYNCGEEGHMAVNCTAAKRKKPCFVCGSFEHNAKQCTKGRDCFICKQEGHRAKDCPDRNIISSKICLKCGDRGHDMFSCRNDYYPEDLEEIQCYVCGKFGHLCCKDYGNEGAPVLSCYRCGLTGHTGLACTWQPGEKNDLASANACYRCGLGGHFARECTSSLKASKRHREPSTPKQKSLKKNKDRKESKSAPQDFGKTRTKKKSKYHQEFTSATKSKSQYRQESPLATKTKSRGGWITEDPEYYYPSKLTSNNYWRSPATPTNRWAKIYNSNGDYPSSSRSSKKPHKLSYDDSEPNGSKRSYQPRYSAARFGSSNNKMEKNYDWW